MLNRDCKERKHNMRCVLRLVNPNIGIFCITLCFAVLFLYACDGSGGSDGAASGTGSINFALNFNDPSSAAVSKAQASPSGDVCVDYEIIEIAVDVKDSTNSVVASDSFPCSDREGTIDNVPAGSGLSLMAKAITGEGKAEWAGQKIGITVTANQNTNEGLIDLFYIGDDTDPPQVVDTIPEDGAEDVLPDTSIITNFNERMVVASINDATFTVKEDDTGEQVSGSRTFDNEKQKLTFKPDKNLSLSTTYTVTISKEVQDLAGLEMEEDYKWSFTIISPKDWYKDNDSDGYSDGTKKSSISRPGINYYLESELTATSGDCNDDDASIHPGAKELCDNKDNDCDGQIDEGLEIDKDKDGYSAPGSCTGTKNDCNDNDASIHPGAKELCDNKDNDCDGQIDEGLTFDKDGDGHTTPGSCKGTKDDCNDNDARVHPGAKEVCDDKDNDCDGKIDEGLTFDKDGDGHTTPGSCKGTKDDCNDNDASIHPGAKEVCDDKDNDCDGKIDEDIECLFYFDDGNLQGWKMKGIYAYSTWPKEYSPNPFGLTWDDRTQYPYPIDSDPTGDKMGSASAATANFRLPSDFPAKELWFIDLISPEVTTNGYWQGITGFELNVVHVNMGTKVQFLLNATRKSDGKETWLREEDIYENPVFHTLKVNWQTHYLNFGNIMGYVINNIRLRIWGGQTHGSGKINIDNVIPRYGTPTIGVEGEVVAGSMGELGPYISITYNSDFIPPHLTDAQIDFRDTDLIVDSIAGYIKPIVKNVEVIKNEIIDIDFSDFIPGETATIRINYYPSFTPKGSDYEGGKVNLSFAGLPGVCTVPLKGLFKEQDALTATAPFSCKP